MSENRLSRLQSAVIHPAISILLPFTFLLTFISLITGGFHLSGIGAPTLLLTFAAGIAEALAANMILKERAGFVARLREFILVVAVSYAVLALTRSGPVSARFQPDVLLVIRTAIVALGWALSFSVHRRLRSREEFFRIVAGKHGESLNRAIRDSAQYMGETRQDLLNVKRIAHVLLGVTIVTLLIQWVSGYPPTRAGFAMVCVFAVVYVGTYVAIQGFLAEFFVSGEGVLLSSALMRRRFVFAGIIAGVAAVLALMLSADRSLLPYSILIAFFNWLSSIVPRDHGAPLPQVSESSPQTELLRKLMQNPQFHEPSQFMKELVKILRIAGLVVVIALVVGFVFAPFVSRSFAEFLRHAHPLRTIGRKLMQLVHYLRNRIKALARGLYQIARAFRMLFARASDTESDVSPFAPRERRKPPIPTAKKLLELGEILKEYVRIVEWAEEQGVRRSNTRTASEFATEIVATGAADPTLLRRVIVTLDESLYSDHILGDEQLDTFHRDVETIVRVKRSQNVDR